MLTSVGGLRKKACAKAGPLLINTTSPDSIRKMILDMRIIVTRSMLEDVHAGFQCLMTFSRIHVIKFLH